MHIDEKFKDAAPSETVERIKSILKELDITLSETWTQTEIDDCFGLRVHTPAGFPSANGKGITQDFARGSAYGEFMERLQSGLFLYKYQSLETSDEVYLHSYAPDGRYVSRQELLEDSEWMEPIVKAYGISREAIAEQCEMYAESKNILMLPYYDLFRDRYVSLPAGFVEHIYSANGCCVGNTREEAWIHALSEIMERHCCITLTANDISVPVIPEQTLRQYKTVSKILDRIRSEGNIDVRILDTSLGLGYPVVAAQLIDKKTHRYVVSFASDPILEIAIERSLTEIFQGRRLSSFGSAGSSQILCRANDVNVVNNVLNQLEASCGAMNVRFFTENELPCSQFPDYSHLSNKELVCVVLDYFREKELPVYVRNYSYLGFHCYKFVIPGFSEARGLRLKEKYSHYLFGTLAAPALRNMRKADELAMHDVLTYHKLVQGINLHEFNFPRNAGIPLQRTNCRADAAIHYAYAAYRLKQYAVAADFLRRARAFTPEEDKRGYLDCMLQYLQFKIGGLSDETILPLLPRFFTEQDSVRLSESLKEHGDIFSDLLYECCLPKCAQCRHRDTCAYEELKRVITNAGKRYAAFTDAQARENFIIA